MTRQLTITVPLPAAALNPNARGHWSTKCRFTKRYREAGYLAALDALNRARIRTPFSRATVEPHFFFRTARRRDKDNCAASLKAVQDGLADAGIVSDDCAITQLPPIFDVDKDHPRVELTVRRTDA